MLVRRLSDGFGSLDYCSYLCSMETTEKISLRMSKTTLARLKFYQTSGDTRTDVIEQYVNYGMDCADQARQAMSNTPIPDRVALVDPPSVDNRSDDRAADEMRANYENAAKVRDEAKKADEKVKHDEAFSTVGPTDLMEKYGDRIRKEYNISK